MTVADRLVIDDLSLENVYLREHVASLQADIVTRDEMISVALEQLSEKNKLIKAQERQLRFQRQQLRSFSMTASASEAAA